MGIWSTGSPSYIHPKNNKYNYLGNAVKNNKMTARDIKVLLWNKKRLCEIKNLEVQQSVKCEKYPSYWCER